MSVYSALRSKRLVMTAVVPAAVVASGALVWQSSYSAFSATTSTPTNNWASGTVALSDNANTALFNVTNLKPGATGVKCINVTSTGSLASTVKLYGTNYATTNGLADAMNLQIEEGSGATDTACTGFTSASTLYNGVLSTFAASKTSFATGVSSWAPTASETKSYKITYTLSATAPNTAQGGSAALGFTWEAQNS